MNNVLDLRGPEFLELYVALLAAALVVAFVMRWLLRGPGGEVPRFVARLEPLEVACLARGPQGVADAIITDLVHRRVVALDAKKAKSLSRAERFSVSANLRFTSKPAISMFKSS